MTISPDRARSRLQSMTKTQLYKLADAHHVDKTDHGRNLSRKRLVARLMLVDAVVREHGEPEGGAR